MFFEHGGRPYYHNASTNETVWARPQGFANSRAGTADVAGGASDLL